MPTAVGMNGPTLSIHFQILTEISIGITENKDKITPTVKADASLSMA